MRHVLALSFVFAMTAALSAADWPMWGGTPARNMVSAMTGAPTEWDVKSGKNVKWVAELGSQSYGNPTVGGGVVIIGTNNELMRDGKQAGDRGVVMAFREANFLTSNMVTAVVGDQTHEDVVERVAAAFERMPNGGKPVFEKAPFPPAKPRRIEETIPSSQAQVVLGLPAPGADHPDTYALDIVSATLGEVGRRLVREIRDQRGLASSVGSSYSTLSDVGCWWAMVGTSPGNVDQVIELTQEQMRRIRLEPLSESEMEDAKSYIEGRAVLGLQTSIAFAQYLADREAIGVEPPLQEYLNRVGKVTVEDVQRVAQAYLDPDAGTLVILRPA